MTNEARRMERRRIGDERSTERSRRLDKDRTPERAAIRFGQLKIEVGSPPTYFKKDDDIFDPDYDPNLDFDDLENLVDNENALKAKSTKKDIIDCNLCGQKCRGQQRLNTHIQRKHNQIFSCRICGEKCHGLQNFKIHRKAGLK